MILLLIIVIICIFMLWLYKNIFFPRKYKDVVEQAASIYNVDPNLIYAVIKQESKFNKNAVSKSGAKGLMQIMDSTAKDMVKNIDSIDKNSYDIYDAYTNIFIGTKYLSYLISHFDGNYYLAIAAYNAGMGNVDGWIEEGIIKDDGSDIENIPYKETNNYVRKIMRDYKIYKDLYK